MKKKEQFQESLFQAGDMLAESIINEEVKLTKWDSYESTIFFEVITGEERSDILSLGVSKSDDRMLDGDINIFRNETSVRLAKYIKGVYKKNKRTELENKMASIKKELEELDKD